MYMYNVNTWMCVQTYYEVCVLPLSSMSVSLISNRACLDCRRLEEAHLKYAVLCIYQRYSQSFPRWVIASDTKQTLENITPLFYKAFSEHYACILNNNILNPPSCSDLISSNCFWFSQHTTSEYSILYVGTCIRMYPIYTFVGFVHTAHKCSYPGCNDVDGNMKNQRCVCCD